MNTRTLYLLTALALSFAAIEPSSADSQEGLSLAQALREIVVAQDYRSASKRSLQLANEYRQDNKTTAACEELARSLDYYRKALAQAADPSWDVASADGDGGDGMQEIRSRFGCTRTQFS